MFLEEDGIIIDYLRILILNIGTYYTNLKLINISEKRIRVKNIISIVFILLFSIFSYLIRKKVGFLYSIFFSSLFNAIIISKEARRSFTFSILCTFISFSLNYIVFLISITLNFFPSVLIPNINKYIIFIGIIIIYIILLNITLKTKRINKGLTYLKENFKDEYFNILILNISIVILFFIILLSNYSRIMTNNIFWGIIISTIIMSITIQKSLQLYYKQKLLIKDLNETKEELDNKHKEIEELERENLNFSKTSHSIAHKQKALEYKLNQLMLKNEIADEIDLKDRIHTISKEISERTTEIELSKTDIPEIDDMLKYMQSECIKNKIDFQLKINGNIHNMINNYVSKEDLEILLADHIKNAIIAINYSENINKSILVRIGNIDGIFSLYVYDSGIEFEKDTLIKLGKKPITTHADNGGTGMGFMNTFDALNKYRASITIEEHNKPCKEDFTKLIKVEFDNKNEYKIVSYRYEEIKENCEKSIDIILKKW